MLFAHLSHPASVVTAIVAGTMLIGLAVHRYRSTGWFPRRRALWAVAVAGVAFQVLHFAEHLLQAGYWLLHPTQAPWMTPWGKAGRDALSAETDGQMATGTELLHLLGNGVFFVGLAAAGLLAHRLLAAARSAPTVGTLRQRLPGLHKALWAQGFHLAEHVLLTLTWMWGGSAIGFTNLFGTIEPGTTLVWTTRVWAHFALNLVATVYAVVGVRELHGLRTRAKLDATETRSHQPRAAPAGRSSPLQGRDRQRANGDVAGSGHLPSSVVSMRISPATASRSISRPT